jgi:hypothetical protein
MLADLIADPFGDRLRAGAGAAVFGLFGPIFAHAGTVQPARPGSPWPSRRDDAGKSTRAAERYGHQRLLTRTNRRLGDLVAGALDSLYPRKDVV